MKTLTINFENVARETLTVKSECAMWNALRKVRDELTDADLEAKARVLVTDADGNLFKDITFKRNAKGKIEMPNAVKETNRVRTKKTTPAVEVAEEAATPSGATEADLSDVLADAQNLADVSEAAGE